MGMPGLPELIVIFAVVFLVFGAKRLPELGGAIGESIKNLRKGLKDEAPTLPSAKGDTHESQKEKTDA